MASLGTGPWFVRTKGAPHIAVGIFVCPVSMLGEFVDECTPPDDCEYAQIGYGSVLFEGRQETPIPEDWEQSDEPDGAYLGELWMGQVFWPSSDLEWNDVPPI